MRIFTYSFRILFLVSICSAGLTAAAQPDSTAADTTSKKMNMDAIYNRPFLVPDKFPVALGGYVEANTQYEQTDGISDGFSFQFRRMTLFLSSTVAKKIKFLSEIEFEDGTKEINIEYAAIDIAFHPLLNLRGGIVMNPIGGFNQNHDGPKWDFVDRPISATTILPATLSNTGFGLHGKQYSGNWIIGYEIYLTNGFDDRIISNEENRTALAAGKSNPEKFEESNSGLPMFTGKLALRNRGIGEIGLSFVSGIYNKWKDDGFILDEKRNASAVAVDFTTSLLKNRINITGEAAKVYVDVPETYIQLYGTKQVGAFVDVIATVLQRKMFDWENAKLNVGVRFDYADYNQGKFDETKGDIGDEVWAFVPAIAFRPAGTTVLRFNYRFGEQKDFLNNPTVKTGAIQFGLSTYF
jgi:hypothetical protein